MAPHERDQCAAEDRAVWGVMHLALLGRQHAMWFVLCHPCDRGPPHPSLLACREFSWFVRQTLASTIDIDLCMHGADTRRRTTLCSNDVTFMNELRADMQHHCAHNAGHRRPATVWGRPSLALFALPASALRLCMVALARAHDAGARCQ